MPRKKDEDEKPPAWCLAVPRTDLEFVVLRGMLEEIRQHEAEKDAWEGIAVANRYLLEHGRFYTPYERPKKYRRGKQKECYGASQMLALENRELTYVEGLSFKHVGGLLRVEHGWCVTQEGKVVDPTWQEPGLVYLGIPFEYEFIRRHMLKNLGERVQSAVLGPEVYWPGQYEHIGGGVYRRRDQTETGQGPN